MGVAVKQNDEIRALVLEILEEEGLLEPRMSYDEALEIFNREMEIGEQSAVDGGWHDFDDICRKLRLV